MRIIAKLLGTLPLLLALSACGTKTRSDNGGSTALSSRRTGALQPANGGSGLALTDALLSGQQIVVDLATTPFIATNWAPAACQTVLPQDFVLGQATCADDPAKTAAITAANARQICTAEPDLGVDQAPLAAVRIDGCAKADLAFYGFTPALSIQIEAAP